MDQKELATIVQAVVASMQPKAAAAPRKARKTKAAKGKRGKLTETERAAHMAKNDAEAIAKFEMAGFQDVKPRVNVLTYDKWIAQGRLVKKGEKSTKVGPFRLFHISQTDPLPAAPVAAAAALTAETATTGNA